MNRIRGGAATLGAALFIALLAASQVARAQEITGRVTGRVVDQDSGAPLGGVTVIAQGPQGEDATLTDDRGDYLFTALPPGTYVLRFYVANASSQIEQPDVVVAADKTKRVNARIAGAVQATAQQTYVITAKAPSVDVGSARVGANFDQDYMNNVPNGRTYGDVISRAPGAFVDGSGNVSIGGSTGLENIYVVNGVNVTGMDVGNLESGGQSLGGGTNLPVEFLTTLDVNSGGYQAEYGGGMGGVINSVLKSGSNEWHGSAFTLWSPYWLSGDTRSIRLPGSALGMVRKPDFDTSIGAEVGGPIIKDKLFFWAGFAPRFNNTHVFRLTYAQQEAMDASGMGTGMPVVDANGSPVVSELTDWRARVNESRKTLSYATTIDFIPRPDHRLTLALFGTPSFNEQMRSTFGGALDAIANPAWMKESLNKTNTDVTLRYLAKLLDKRWIIEANAGLHREDFRNQSPSSTLNALNQLEYHNTSLWELERAPGCEPTASGFQPCPVGVTGNPYHTGGYGLTRAYTGHRWMGEVKSTHLFQAGGRHELKYGYRLEFVDFEQDRYYSGPPGSRALVILAPNGGGPVGIPDPYFSTFSFFTLQPGQFPTDFGGMGRPTTDLLQPPIYQDNLKANVTSLSNAFFVQDSFSPNKLRNLSINAGARLEMQKLTDTHSVSFLNTNNFGPRVSVVYDPFSDGRSKVSASYGRFYETIPMNMAARYFGGEGILTRNGVPLSTCANPNGFSWTGAAEWNGCNRPAVGATTDAAIGGTAPFNNGSSLPVQQGLKGQYHNEVVATLERELIENLTARIDYVHRWIGTIVEDGTADPSGSFGFVLVNPGDIPQSSLDAAQKDIDRLMAQDPTGMDARIQSELAAAQAKLANLEGLAAAPKPKRTYDGITLSLSKRFSKNWLARAGYTYSRLVGNYQGLFQNESSYFAPNGSNAYDTPDLYLNQMGYLPNDRPHHLRMDGYYSHQIGKGTLTFGLAFSARSGMPRNYLSSWFFGQPQQMLLPRGSGGRTEAVTQFDARVSYGRPLTPTVKLDGFIDFFNILNQQATLATDDVYTYDPTAAIVNGTPADLPFAKNLFGGPISRNANYGNALAYQMPFSARLGLRLTF